MFWCNIAPDLTSKMAPVYPNLFLNTQTIIICALFVKIYSEFTQAEAIGRISILVIQLHL